MSDAHDRLRATLGTPALGRLVSRLRRSVERGAPYGRVTIDDPSREERDAIDRLLGRRPSSGRVTVDVAMLEEKLRHAELAETLVEAVETLTGPVLRPLADSRALKAAWFELEASAATRVERDPALQEWWQSLRAEGLLRRLSGGSPEKGALLLESALVLWARLPVDGVPLAELAADVAGDSHGLDAGEPLATLVLRALAIRLDDRDAEPRDLWARMGVVPDALSAPVLVLNLRAAGDGVLAGSLRAHADAGEPFHVTARMLEREAPVFALPASMVVYACENPSIVAAAAERLGARSAPLLCTSGQARAALRSLVRRLRDAGAEIRYHGDFDWPGVQIAKGLIVREGVKPWRMSAADYLAGPDGPPLRGQSVETSWDADLCVAMEKRGVAVQEERVMGALLLDLAGTLAASSVAFAGGRDRTDHLAMVPLSGRFERALAYANQVHSTQTRKGTAIPYVAHLLGTAGIALEHGANEDEAIAALLHDAVEDQGGAARLAEIRGIFGDVVADIVAACSDTDQVPKPPWRERKEAYLRHLRHASASVRLVSASDKLHNARAIVSDLHASGAAVWTRFSAGVEDQLWYYSSLAQVFEELGPSRLAAELRRAVHDMKRLA